MSDTYRLAEERLGEDLAGRLHYWHAAGVPAPAIARLLALETQVSVSPQTIRRWIERTSQNDAA